MVGERIKEAVPEKPLAKRVGDRLDKRSSSFRNKQSRRVRKATPSFERRNIGDGMAVGAIGSAIEDLISSYIPIGSDTEIVGIRESEDGEGVVYTVNTDASFSNMARAEAMMESGAGFASYVTDTMDVADAEVLRTRPLRDTYQVEVKVVD